MTVEGAVDSKVFEVYVQHILAPTLVPGHIVVMDNLGAHKAARVRELIEARGAGVEFLPTYSPDLSPIEEAFSKIKEILRRAEARTKETLEAVIAEALDAVTPEDASGWFRHCGYHLAQ